MFAFLRSLNGYYKLLVTGNFTTKRRCFIQTPFLLERESITGRSFSAAVAGDHSSSFTVSYLMNSCGLSKDTAIAASKKVQFESSTKPDLVLNLLRNYEFDNTHISEIVNKFPSVLVCKPDKTLKPKLDFLNSSLGLSGSELADFISPRPHMLKFSSLENSMKPVVAFLKTLFLTSSQVMTIIKRCPRVLQKAVLIKLEHSIALLRAHGVHHLNISMLLVHCPRSLTSNARLDENIKEAKNLKFDPSEKAFTRAVCVLSSLSKSTWDSKFDIYKRWGWSENDIHFAFRKHPKGMTFSEKNIMSTMDFFVNKMGYDPLLFVQLPQLLGFSLEKRIIPRLSIIQVLISNGYVEKDFKLCDVLQSTDERFLKKFVTKYEGKIPALLNTYKGDTECSGFVERNEEEGFMQFVG